MSGMYLTGSEATPGLVGAPVARELCSYHSYPSFQAVFLSYFISSFTRYPPWMSLMCWATSLWNMSILILCAGIPKVGCTDCLPQTTMGALLKCRFLSNTPDLQGWGQEPMAVGELLPQPSEFVLCSATCFSYFLVLRIWLLVVSILFSVPLTPISPTSLHILQDWIFPFPKMRFPSYTMQHSFLEIHLSSRSWIRKLLLCFCKVLQSLTFFFSCSGRTWGRTGPPLL